MGADMSEGRENKGIRSPPASTLTLTGFDVAGLGACVFAIVFALYAIFRAQPSFERSLSELGSALPAFTVLCLSPGFVIVVALLPIVVVSDGILRRVSLKGRAIRMVIAVVLAVLGPAMFALGMYLPIFAMAAAVE